MGHLVCNECEGYYELKTGEKPEDFSEKCPCGGKLEYRENLDISVPMNSSDTSKSDTAKTDPNNTLPKKYLKKNGNGVWENINFKKDLIIAIISIIAIYLLLPQIGIITFLLVGLPAGFALSHWLKLKGTDTILNLVVLGVIFTLGYAFTGLFSFHKMIGIFLVICMLLGVIFFILSFIGVAINQILNERNA